ncbi:unnamed protein product [Urochloa decumbens]|uniref:BURP domain-containing protein n=1 Tax=Urochloa decumbens TaxID=240449 RepID=A0ABC9AZI6_9POAL
MSQYMIIPGRASFYKYHRHPAIVQHTRAFHLPCCALIISIARLLAALLLTTAAALLVVGQRNDAAAPSEGEEFWRTVLPNSPLPDAILMLLHPETNPVKNANDADAQGRSRKNPFSYIGPRFTYGRDGSHKHLSPGPPSSDDDDDTIGAAFFHEEALQVGENLTLYFPPAIAEPLGLLPRHVADSIPFSVSSLPDALALLGIAADSAHAANMQQALEMCESPTVFCATSLEALVEAAMASLGTRDLRPVTSTLPHSGMPLQQYSIRAVRRVDGSSFVACRDQDYPYTIFVCHSTGPSRAYMVDVVGGDMAIVAVAAVCHTNTSWWDPEHIAFKLLGTKPGGAPACHILPHGHMVWANNAARSSA